MKHIPGHGLAKVDSHNFTPIVNKKLSYLIKMIFFHLKKKNFFCNDSTHNFSKIDKENIVLLTLKKLLKLIRNKIGFKNILISDDLSMKSLKR